MITSCAAPSRPSRRRASPRAHEKVAVRRLVRRAAVKRGAACRERRRRPALLIQTICRGRRGHRCPVARIAIHPWPVDARVVGRRNRLRKELLAVRRAGLEWRGLRDHVHGLVQRRCAGVLVREVGGVVARALKGARGEGGERGARELGRARARPRNILLLHAPT
jgi:hypothetical protein